MSPINTPRGGGAHHMPGSTIAYDGHDSYHGSSRLPFDTARRPSEESPRVSPRHPSTTGGVGQQDDFDRYHAQHHEHHHDGARPSALDSHRRASVGYEDRAYSTESVAVPARLESLGPTAAMDAVPLPHEGPGVEAIAGSAFSARPGVDRERSAPRSTSEARRGGAIERALKRWDSTHHSTTAGPASIANPHSDSTAANTAADRGHGGAPNHPHHRNSEERQHSVLDDLRRYRASSSGSESQTQVLGHAASPPMRHRRGSQQRQQRVATDDDVALALQTIDEVQRELRQLQAHRRLAQLSGSSGSDRNRSAALEKGPDVSGHSSRRSSVSSAGGGVGGGRGGALSKPTADDVEQLKQRLRHAERILVADREQKQADAVVVDEILRKKEAELLHQRSHSPSLHATENNNGVTSSLSGVSLMALAVGDVSASMLLPSSRHTQPHAQRPAEGDQGDTTVVMSAQELSERTAALVQDFEAAVVPHLRTVDFDVESQHLLSHVSSIVSASATAGGAAVSGASSTASSRNGTPTAGRYGTPGRPGAASSRTTGGVGAATAAQQKQRQSVEYLSRAVAGFSQRADESQRQLIGQLGHVTAALRVETERRVRAEVIAQAAAQEAVRARADAAAAKVSLLGQLSTTAELQGVLERLRADMAASEERQVDWRRGLDLLERKLHMAAPSGSSAPITAAAAGPSPGILEDVTSPSPRDPQV